MPWIDCVPVLSVYDHESEDLIYDEDINYITIDNIRNLLAIPGPEVLYGEHPLSESQVLSLRKYLKSPSAPPKGDWFVGFCAP